MAAPDLDVIKDIPGYKVILKAIVKSQIQQLVSGLWLKGQQNQTRDEREMMLILFNILGFSSNHFTLTIKVKKFWTCFPIEYNRVRKWSNSLLLLMFKIQKKMHNRCSHFHLSCINKCWKNGRRVKTSVLQRKHRLQISISHLYKVILILV